MKPSRSSLMSLRQAIEGCRAGEKSEFPTILILAAHPDDEVIGASLLLQSLRVCTVVFLTDGAPRDCKFWPQDAGITSREGYAAIRREEATSVLSIIGVAPEQIIWLEAVDQESLYEAPRLAQELVAVLRNQRPDLLITHAYEGGHPDHDAAALIAKLALSRLRRDNISAPELLEMTSYHARGGECRSGEFLRCNSSQEIAVRLSPQEFATKRKMFARYHLQRHVLKQFRSDVERWRPAPTYDFAKPPHAGKLWYECLGWRMTGEHWREIAVEALSGCDEAVRAGNSCA